MNKEHLFALLVLTSLLVACEQTTKVSHPAKSPAASTVGTVTSPRFDYHIEPPGGWEARDTIIQGLRVRFLIAPPAFSLDRPQVNIVITAMDGVALDSFTTLNRSYMEKNRPGVVFQETGDIIVDSHRARWITYTLPQNGLTREMINYIIPVNGFAYMITAGSNAGSAKKYRPIFDNVARSFRL